MNEQPPPWVFEVLQTVGALMSCVNTLLLALVLVGQRLHLRKETHYLEVTKQLTNLMTLESRDTGKKVDEFIQSVTPPGMKADGPTGPAGTGGHKGK